MSQLVFNLKAHGHKNVTSLHKSTFEITKDKNLTLKGDCIIGVDMDKTMLDFPEDFKLKLKNSKTKVTINLKTLNAKDTIRGWGSEDLTLTHPTDIVCRKSTFTCDRTLMINADKAAKDLKPELINDLSNNEILECEIILE